MSKQLTSVLHFLLLALRKEQGQGIAEYTLLIFFIAVVLMISFSTFAGALVGTYGTITTAIVAIVQ